MHSFEVHSNESACRKKVHLGLEQVIWVPEKCVAILSKSIVISEK